MNIIAALFLAGILTLPVEAEGLVQGDLQTETIEVPRPTLRIHNLPKGFSQIKTEHIMMAVGLIEKVYGEIFTKDIDIYVMEENLLNPGVHAFYDYRGPLIMIRASSMKNEIWTVYLLAHELGHHTLHGKQENDHCLMYDPEEGYDVQILLRLGIPLEEIHNTFVDPFRYFWACQSDYE